MDFLSLLKMGENLFLIAFLLLRLQRANGFDHIHPGRYTGLCASGAFSPFAKHQY